LKLTTIYLAYLEIRCNAAGIKKRGLDTIKAAKEVLPVKYFVTDDCVGCGACWSTCPAVFSQRDDGMATAMEGDVPQSAEDLAMLAKESCPVEAIKSEE